jgi:glycosyltransferase involved in cell wall biosynthesis
LQQSRVTISVVVPVAEPNRYDNLDEIYWAYAERLSRDGYSFEFLFVIDGGLEGAARRLDPLVAVGYPLRIVQLPRGFGESTALAVGFEQAAGDVIVTVPAYFQTEPAGVEQVLDLLNQGFDLVVARRSPRKDAWLNRLQNSGFHFLLRYFTGITFQDMGCGLRGFKRRVLSEVQVYGDLHRFIPILAHQRGFRVTEVPVAQHQRDMKLRLYRPGVYLRRVLDILTVVFLFKFTKKPLRFFGLIGASLFGTGATISAVLAFQRLMGSTALADRPLLILGVLLMVLGVQVGSIGLLGEMIIFTHARKLKDYAIDKVLR